METLYRLAGGPRQGRHAGRFIEQAGRASMFTQGAGHTHTHTLAGYLSRWASRLDKQVYQAD